MRVIRFYLHSFSKKVKKVDFAKFGRFKYLTSGKMLETSRCISIFEQIVATVPFYTRAYFDIV